MRSVATTTLLVLVAANSRADEQAAGPILDRYLGAAQELTAVLKEIKDRPTATAARARVVQHHDAMSRSQKELRKIDVASIDKKPLDERIRKAMAPFDAEFRRLSLIPEAFAVLADIDLFRIEAEVYELQARMIAVKIDLALSLYKLEHGRYPPDLKEGFKTVKKEPPRDPWGREYQYDRLGLRNLANDAKDHRPDIWVVSPYGDGKKLLGNWEDKKK